MNSLPQNNRILVKLQQGWQKTPMFASFYWYQKLYFTASLEYKSHTTSLLKENKYCAKKKTSRQIRWLCLLWLFLAITVRLKVVYESYNENVTRNDVNIQFWAEILSLSYKSKNAAELPRYLCSKTDKIGIIYRFKKMKERKKISGNLSEENDNDYNVFWLFNELFSISFIHYGGWVCERVYL